MARPTPMEQLTAQLGHGMLANLKANAADPEIADAAVQARDEQVAPSQLVQFGQPSAAQQQTHQQAVEEARQASDKAVQTEGS